jgi:hypothetical protein
MYTRPNDSRRKAIAGDHFDGVMEMVEQLGGFYRAEDELKEKARRVWRAWCKFGNLKSRMKIV